jgi:glutathione S-transferase
MACCSGIAKLLGATDLDLWIPKKVTYFELVTPRGMPSICCLEISGRSYNWKAVTMAEWDDLKPKVPGGQLPYAEFGDGTVICDSGAVGRSIAGAAGLLGSGIDFARSEMLVGIAADLDKAAMEVVPTIFTVASLTPAKKAAFPAGKDKVLTYCDKAAGFLLPSGDKFTSSGLTYGEIQFFCVLYCHAEGAIPEVKSGGLKSFYNRMAEVPGIKKVIDGKSKLGTVKFLIPMP